MSTIEQRLARDIAAVTQGVVVTDTDMTTARESIDERIQVRQRHDRRRRVAALAAAAVVIPVLGAVAITSFDGDDRSAPPASPGSPSPGVDDPFLEGEAPTTELVTGVWRLDNGTRLVRFGSDGTVQMDTRGHLLSSPQVVGTYEISDDVVEVTADGDSPQCAGGTIALRASFPGDGLMRFVHTGEPSDCWGADAARGTFEQLLPTSPDLVQLRLPGAGAEWLTPYGTEAMHGVWMSAGGGHVLEMAPTGDYVIAAGSGDAVDRGRWTLDGSRTQLTLESSQESETCSPGDRLVLDGVGQVNPGAVMMRGDVRQSTCSDAWASGQWIQLPQADG